MTILPLGDAAAVQHLDGPIDAAMATRVRALAGAIARQPPAGVTDVVPAFASVAVFFDPVRAAAFEELRAELEALATSPPSLVVEVGAARVVEVPVAYGGADGPDLSVVAAHSGLTPDEVIARHAAGDYLVHAIGFAPGFPYLGGLDPRLATPRRASPRASVPAGSVGIGGAQTGVYPFATPGGWNLIGRTPLALFDPGRKPAALLRTGDRVKFRAVPASEAVFHSEPAAKPSRPAPAGMEVLKPGMFTTVQDAGRPGHRADGVPGGGAADTLALRLANLLVGNEQHAAGLECTLVGPELRFNRDTLVAWGGATTAALPSWRPVPVRAGDALTIGPLSRGCRGYLAIAGGVETPPQLGSRGTYVRGALGGFDGRALRVGDVVPVGAGCSRASTGQWHIDERLLPAYANPVTVRVVTGAHGADFEDWRGRAFTVSPQSDRMGARLVGTLPRLAPPRELVSSPVAPGTIQVPPDGQPIVLLADAQTIGGYPQVAHVISVDLPLVAQLRPGDTVRFTEVTLAEARRLVLARERALGLLREGLAQKFR